MKENGLPFKKDAGFKVPEGYFQDFEARMMARVTSSEIAPKENPFKVPENYFEQLEERVFERLEKTPKKGKVIPLLNRRTFSYVASIAAVLAILLSSIVFNETREFGFDDLDAIALENYLLESLDFEDPRQVPGEDYIYTTSTNPNIDKEALFEYLNDHIEEPALLFNED